MSYDKAQLTEMFNSTDPGQRREAVGLLTKFGAKPLEHVKWTVEQKVDFILEHAGGEDKPAAAKAATPKTATTKTASAKAKSEATKSEASASGGVSDAAILAAIGELAEKVDNLQATVDGISAGVDENLAFSREGHFFGMQLALAMGADLSDQSTLGSVVFGDAGNDEG